MRSKLDKQWFEPLFRLIRMAGAASRQLERVYFMDRTEIDTTIRSLIEPFNKKEVDISDATTFANDLEFDSLTVMDFVAAIEDEYDIIISMNQQAEIENFGQLVDAVTKLQAQ